MRKILLMSSALALLSGTVEAGCIQTPSCSSLGYSSTTACEGGLKCPWGNAWFCNVGGGSSTPDYSNCKIGDILYSDMSCNSDVVASKTSIGVIFDVTNGLAVAKDEFSNLPWSGDVKDVPGAPNYSSTTLAQGDWWGFNNTKAMYEFDSTGENYPLIVKALQYNTTGTEQGQWYIPAMGELKTISDNKDVINAAMSKIGTTKLSGNYWSSTEQNSSKGYLISIGGNISSTSKFGRNKLRPIINFINKNKIEFSFVFGGEKTCEVGDILYSDKKCYLGGMLAGKTPIGVVFDAENRKAIALESSERMSWSTELSDVSGISNTTDMEKAKQDFNGKANTAAIKAKNSNLSKYPAAKYAYDYTTPGTNEGDWYLPALGEMYMVYTNKDFLNYTLPLVGKNAMLSSNHWSSSEYSSKSAWDLHLSDGSTTFKGNADFTKIKLQYYVRPVLAF